MGITPGTRRCVSIISILSERWQAVVPRCIRRASALCGLVALPCKDAAVSGVRVALMGSPSLL